MPFTKWQGGTMNDMDKINAVAPLTPRLLSALYTDALLLLDESRACFEANEAGVPAPEPLSPASRVALACEGLRVTTRLMHVIAWLMSRRAQGHELVHLDDGLPAMSALGQADPTRDEQLELLPETARHIARTSMDLYDRVRRMDRGTGQDLVTPVIISPAHGLVQRLHHAF